MTCVHALARPGPRLRARARPSVGRGGCSGYSTCSVYAEKKRMLAPRALARQGSGTARGLVALVLN
eukprot:5953233-Prymnesium_polylepis.1